MVDFNNYYYLRGYTFGTVAYSLAQFLFYWSGSYVDKIVSVYR